MSLFVKICGISDAALAVEACRAGADAVGFVFDRSPRRVTPEQAVDLAAEIPDHTAKVAVFRRPDQPRLDRVLRVFRPDLVQADHDAPIILPPGVGFLPVYRDGSAAIPDHGALILYEGLRSGVGERADWERARSLASTTGLILAGGLDPSNVTEAVETVGPYGVDVSTGVESSPGQTDPRLIHLFITRARRAAAARTARAATS